MLTRKLHIICCALVILLATVLCCVTAAAATDSPVGTWLMITDYDGNDALLILDIREDSTYTEILYFTANNSIPLCHEQSGLWSLNDTILELTSTGSSTFSSGNIQNETVVTTTNFMFANGIITNNVGQMLKYDSDTDTSSYVNNAPVGVWFRIVGGKCEIIKINTDSTASQVYLQSTKAPIGPTMMQGSWTMNGDALSISGLTGEDYSSGRYISCHSSGCTLYYYDGMLSYDQKNNASADGVSLTFIPNNNSDISSEITTTENIPETVDTVNATNINEYIELAKGSKGEDVKTLQEHLIALGYLKGNADGDFGNKTFEAVKAFQKDNGLEETGIADPRTQSILFAKKLPVVSDIEITTVKAGDLLRTGFSIRVDYKNKGKQKIRNVEIVIRAYDNASKKMLVQNTEFFSLCVDYSSDPIRKGETAYCEADLTSYFPGAAYYEATVGSYCFEDGTLVEIPINELPWISSK